MITLHITGQQIPARTDETVLDALLRAGVAVPHGCRSGVCGACTIVCTAGQVPAESQVGLREVERKQGMFLACQCHPQTDLELRMLDDAMRTPATIIEHERLSDSVARIRLAPQGPFEYLSGQYIAVARDDGLVRSYSIASLPSEPWIELHVRKVKGGSMSTWLVDEATPGASVSLLGPRGSCCYPSDELDAPLLLVAVGTGLAPLWGVLRDALSRGHRGPITVMHAGVDPDSLYMRDDLRELADAHPQVQLRTIVLRGAEAEPGVLEQGSVVTLAGAVIECSANPERWLSFVCGDPDIVKALKFELFMAGAASARILADAFETTPPGNLSRVA